MKLSPKFNRGFFCECIRVKPSCKSIITTKEALLRFTLFSFSGQTHFQWECYGHFYPSFKISVFKTVRSLDTTWNFAGRITRVSTHEHQHWQHCLGVWTTHVCSGLFRSLKCWFLNVTWHEGESFRCYTYFWFCLYKVNFVLFISIIRILVQKLRCTDVGGNEQSQYRLSPKTPGQISRTSLGQKDMMFYGNPEKRTWCRTFADSTGRPK